MGHDRAPPAIFAHRLRVGRLRVGAAVELAFLRGAVLRICLLRGVGAAVDLVLRGGVLRPRLRLRAGL